METDLLVSTLPAAAVIEGLLGLPGAYCGSRGIVFAGEQEITAVSDPNGTTNIVVYDRGAKESLAHEVFAHLAALHPDAGLIRYDAKDEIAEAIHPALIAA